MLAMASKIGDKALGALLGRTEAGACVPPDYCYCYNGYKYVYNCYGTCVKSTYRC